MEKSCISCKWYNEDKKFCKWISGYTKEDQNCKNWKNDSVNEEDKK